APPFSVLPVPRWARPPAAGARSRPAAARTTRVACLMRIAAVAALFVALGRCKECDDVVEVFFVELPVGGGDVLLDLPGLGGAGDDAGDFGAGEQPGEGEFEQVMVAFGAPGLQPLHPVPVVFGEVAVAEALPVREARVFRRGLV